MGTKDLRLKMMNEILNGIKVITETEHAIIAKFILTFKDYDGQ